jgi:hypothetical protein
MSVWILLALNPSGNVMYAYGFSTQALANTAQGLLNADLVPGWTSLLLQVPALDTTYAQGAGGVI